MLNHVNFPKSWPELLDQKHKKWKNHEASSPTNQTLNDKTM
jgi:hypothetical protein